MTTTTTSKRNHIINFLNLVFPAVLTVHITVTRTDPSGFTPGSDIEYRAASGPHTFTCTAEGGAGSGAYQYVWTSNSSTFSTSPPNGVIIRQAVHSGDNGTHTCTASRGGESGSANTVVTIVGEWLLLSMQTKIIYQKGVPGIPHHLVSNTPDSYNAARDLSM